MKYGVFVNPGEVVANPSRAAFRYRIQTIKSGKEYRVILQGKSYIFMLNDDKDAVLVHTVNGARIGGYNLQRFDGKLSPSSIRNFLTNSKNPGEVENPDFSWSHPNAHQWFLLYRGRSVARVTKNNERSYSAQSEHNAADDEKSFRLLSTAKQYALKLAKGSKGAVKADMLTQAEMLDVVNKHGNKTIIKQHGEAVRIEPTTFSKDRWNIYFADGFSVRNARIPKLKNPKPPKLRGYIDPDKGYAKRIADISKTPTKANVFKALDRLHGASYSAFGVIRKHFNLTEAEWQPLFNEWYNSPSKNPAIKLSEREYTKLFDKGGKDQYVHYRIKSTGYEGLTLRYAGERLHPFKKRVADDNRVSVGDVEIIADSQAIRGNPKKKLDSFEDQHLTAWIAKHYRPGEARRVKRNILRFLSYSSNYNYGDRGWSDTVRAAEYVADKSITESDFLSWVR